jgi:hypothetical protein
MDAMAMTQSNFNILNGVLYYIGIGKRDDLS